MRRTIIPLIVLAGALAAQPGEPYVSKVWAAYRGDGTYQNPILYADYSDPDAIRVDEDYYLVSSSFHAVPGLPILHSKDPVLVGPSRFESKRGMFSPRRGDRLRSLSGLSSSQHSLKSDYCHPPPSAL